MSGDSSSTDPLNMQAAFANYAFGKNKSAQKGEVYLGNVSTSLTPHEQKLANQAVKTNISERGSEDVFLGKEENLDSNTINTQRLITNASSIDNFASFERDISPNIDTILKPIMPENEDNSGFQFDIGIS